MSLPNAFRVRLLGRFEIMRGGRTAAIRLATKKARALVAFLAMSRHHSASREQLATLLWGSCSEQQAKQSLRQALTSIRKDLGSPDALFTDHEIVRFQDGAWSVDALELESLASASRVEDLERVLALYDGEFLVGLSIDEEDFDEWLRAQRDRIQQAAGQAFASYARLADAERRGDQAVAAAERLSALDPFREDWHRLSLELNARYRGRGEALAQAKKFAALLHRELGVAVEPETTAIAEKIGRGEIEYIPATGEPAPRDEIPQPSEIPSGTPGEPVAAPDIARWRRYLSPAYVTAFAALLLFTGALALASGHISFAVPEALRNGLTGSTKPKSDPWQSPKLPSQSNVGLQGPPGKAIASIVVLPFTAYGDIAGADQFVSDVLTEDLTNTLSRVPPLRVISRQTSRSYFGRPIDAAAIGSELNVRYVLEGKLRTVGNKLRVSAELIDPPTRAVIWSVRIEREATERNAILDEIVEQLARQLQFEVYRVESQRASANPDVEELNYKGWNAIFTSATAGVESLREAESYFSQAVARDPQHKGALVGLGAYHTVIGTTLSDGSSLQHMKKGEELLREAIRTNPGSSLAYYFLGIIYRSRGELEAARDSFELVLGINPNSAPTYAHLGHTLLWMGRSREGLEHIRYALRLSPRDATRSHWLRFAGEALMELGQYDDAIAAMRESLALESTSVLTLRSLMAACAVSGRIDEAHQYLAQLQKTAPYLSMTTLTRIAARRKTPEMQRGLQLAMNAPSEAH